MSKLLFWVLASLTIFWLLGDGPATPASSHHSSSQSLPLGFGSHSDGNSSQGHGPQARELSDSVRLAKEQFEIAAGELSSSVDELRFRRWDGQMSNIRQSLDNADQALVELELIAPNDPSVSSARDHVDRMRADFDRLSYENWRTVRPDFDTAASAIEEDAASVSDDIPDDED